MMSLINYIQYDYEDFERELKEDVLFVPFSSVSVDGETMILHFDDLNETNMHDLSQSAVDTFHQLGYVIEVVSVHCREGQLHIIEKQMSIKQKFVHILTQHGYGSDANDMSAIANKLSDDDIEALLYNIYRTAEKSCAEAFDVI